MVVRPEDFMPHFYICDACVTLNGGTQADYESESHTDVCPYCGTNTVLRSIYDFNWPTHGWKASST